METSMSPRSRERILANLESVYRDAYGRAQDAGDTSRMHDLDAAFQREQLILEVLMDIRDALQVRGRTGGGALEHVEALRRITKLR
jgi:hypothetical protein